MQRPRNALGLLGNRLETGRLVLYGLGVGGLVGVLGTLLAFLLEFGQQLLLGLTGLLPPGLPNEGGVLQAFSGSRSWLLPLLMSAALASTVWLERTASRTVFGRMPKAPVGATGDGVNVALDAYHNHQARMGIREIAARTAASALAIMTGVPLGREGGFSSVSAGAGVVFGALGRFSEADRRLVFVAGLAAGLALVLRAPLAAAVLAVEILYRRFEFEIEALTPAVLSSVVAFAIYGSARGFGPLFELPNVAGQPPQLLPAFFALGLLEAAAAFGFVAAFKGLVQAWALTRLPVVARLALAGLVVGLIGVLNPGVLGDGLGWVQLGLSGFLPIWEMLALTIIRAFAVLLIASAGGAGGLIVPSLVIGGLLGNVYALVLGLLGVTLEPTAFALAGMAAFLAGTVNAPLGATLLVTEWSGYGLLVPLLMTTISGYALTGGEGLLDKQAESRSSSQAHINEYLRDALRLAGPQGAIPNQSTQNQVGQTGPMPHLAIDPSHQSVASEVDKSSSDGLNPDLLDLLSGQPLSVSDDDLERLYRMALPDLWIGKTVRELEWPPEALLVAVLREGHVRVPRGATLLEAHDELIVMAEPEAFSRLNSALV